ncbi:hypothetical protein J1N35_027322 [Gossypium stocksii]|uniref:Transmembrane protein n=13 Tax=Gossypium TaxID=3633 RepID=A0A9D3VA40_9ROSI|nr:hypothetical protein J1N35_027322 [Gossypium stocksii]
MPVSDLLTLSKRNLPIIPNPTAENCEPNRSRIPRLTLNPPPLLASSFLRPVAQILCVSNQSYTQRTSQAPKTMPFKTMIEVEPPSPLRYIIGAAVMMIGVVLPVGYMMFRNKRVPSSSSYSKQTNKVLI